MVGSRYYMNKHLLVYSLRPRVDDQFKRACTRTLTGQDSSFQSKRNDEIETVAPARQMPYSCHARESSVSTEIIATTNPPRISTYPSHCGSEGEMERVSTPMPDRISRKQPCLCWPVQAYSTSSEERGSCEIWASIKGARFSIVCSSRMLGWAKAASICNAMQCDQTPNNQ